MKIWCLAVALAGLWAAMFTQVPQSGKRVDLLTYLRAGYGGNKANLIAAAEIMPEGDYRFKPSSMPEVRTFGETILHVASGHFSACAHLRGVSPEPAPRVEPNNKAAVLKVLADSFALCDLALSSLTDATANEFVPSGPVEVPKSAALVGLVAHDAEMYGIATVYLRAKNIVPPSTARQQQNKN